MCDTNTGSDSEQMAMDDILEITAVYGTQIGCIKKEESEISLEFEVEKIFLDPLPYHDVTAIPIVYTTRLDQMNTFNQIERHTPKEATKMILNESKPRYDQIAFKVKPETQSNSSMDSYVNLCRQIKHLNTKVCLETCLRNQKLLKMCKPLRVMLKDLNLNKRKSRPKKKNNVKYITEKYNSTDESSLYSSDDDEPVSKFISRRSNLDGKDTTKLATIIVAVKDKRSQEGDIYITDIKNGVKSYYRTNMNECSILEKAHKSSKTIILEYCCWVNREKQISKVIQLMRYPKAKMFFLKKPHNCFPRPCTCCCVFGRPMLSKNYLISQHTESIHSNDVTDPPASNNIIYKAKNYMPNVPNSMYDQYTMNREVREPIDYLKWAVIIMKYRRIIFAQTESLGVNYEIGSNGEIVNFTRHTVHRTIAEEKVAYEKSLTSKISKIFFSYLICCWQNREDTIVRLRKVTKLLPSVINFIRIPHSCKSGKCVCCCKPRPWMKSRNIIPIQKTKISKEKGKLKSVVKGKIYTKRQRKVPVAKKNKETLKINMDSNNPKMPTRDVLNENVNSESAELPNTSNTDNSTPKPNSYETKNSVKKQSTVQGLIQNVLNSSPEHNAVPSDLQTVTKTIQLDSNVMGTKDITSTSNTTAPTAIVNNILDRFNGLKLTVNENGKLTAIINTAPGKLTTADIKVISDILLLAGSLIEQLGISPQEFCARVNSSRKRNNDVQIPILVPIKPTFNDIQTPDQNLNNMPPRTLQYITPKDPNGCKVQSLSTNSLIPITGNTSSVCSIYQVMSSLGGQKNQHLINAYRLHFKEEKQGANNYQIIKQTQEIAKNLKLLDKPVIATSSGFSRAKRRPPQNSKINRKKRRVQPPQGPILRTLLRSSENAPNNHTKFSVIEQNVKDKLNTPKSVKTTDKNQDQLSKSYKNATPIIANVSYTPAVTDHNLAAFIHNNSFIRSQNTVGTIGSGDAESMTPFFVSNGNIPAGNPSDEDISDLNKFKSQVGFRVPTGNPLLHQMLSQAQASLSLPPVGLNPSLNPQSHNNKFSSTGQFKKQPRKNKTLQLSSDDIRNLEMNLESAIESMVKNLEPNNFTNEEILDAVNNKQLIDSDEEETIFGV